MNLRRAPWTQNPPTEIFLLLGPWPVTPSLKNEADTHIALVLGGLEGVQHLGVIIDAEGTDHLAFALLIVLLVHHLQGHHTHAHCSAGAAQASSPAQGSTHITGIPAVGLGCQQGDGIHLDVELLSFALLPVVLVDILEKIHKRNQKNTH